jgi:hypothetical protein
LSASKAFCFTFIIGEVQYCTYIQKPKQHNVNSPEHLASGLDRARRQITQVLRC